MPSGTVAAIAVDSPTSIPASVACSLSTWTSVYAFRSPVVNRKPPSGSFSSSQATSFTWTPSCFGSVILWGLGIPHRSTIAEPPHAAVSGDSGSVVVRARPATVSGSSSCRAAQNPAMSAGGVGGRATRASEPPGEHAERANAARTAGTAVMVRTRRGRRWRDITGQE